MKKNRTNTLCKPQPARKGPSRIALTLLLPVLFLFPESFVLGNSPRWFENLPAALKDAKNHQRPVFLHIYADWCPNCRRLENTVYPSAKVSPVLDRFTRLRINGDIQENKVVSDQFQVRGFPTLLVLDPSGAVLARMEGGASASMLTGFLEESREKRNRLVAIQEALSKDPDSAQALFDAGIFYSEYKNHQEARDYFLKAWSRGKAPQSLRLDALFNAAVNTMELGDHTSSISLWNTYLALRKKEDRNWIYARLYRGLAYYRSDNQDRARDDLQYAVTRITDPKLRKSAKKILDSL